MGVHNVVRAKLKSSASFNNWIASTTGKNCTPDNKINKNIKNGKKRIPVCVVNTLLLRGNSKSAIGTIIYENRPTHRA
jgi:hypothetical protein